DRSDHRSGTTTEDLRDVASLNTLFPFFGRDSPFFDGQPVVLSQDEQGIAGDARKQGTSEFRSHQPGPRPFTKDEAQIVSAELLHPAALDRIEPHHLVATVIEGLLLDHQ